MSFQNDNPEIKTDYQFWLDFRQYLLGLVALIERKIKRRPTTKEKSDFWKEQHYES